MVHGPRDGAICQRGRDLDWSIISSCTPKHRNMICRPKRTVCVCRNAAKWVYLISGWCLKGSGGSGNFPPSLSFAQFGENFIASETLVTSRISGNSVRFPSRRLFRANVIDDKNVVKMSQNRARFYVLNATHFCCGLSFAAEIA